MKHRTGYLFKRGSTFYVFWRLNGKAFSKALRDDNGNPITTKREAEEAKTKLMAPFTVADEAAALESIAGKIAGRHADMAKLDDEQNPPLELSQAWAEYLSSANRPDSGEETLYQYSCQFSAFQTWMDENHPDTLALRGVTRQVAEAYSAYLSREKKVSANTYNKHLNLLSLVFRVVKQKAKLTANPWEDLQRKRLVTQSRRELTIDELKNVCRTAEGELKLLFALGIYSGLRLGDCATLRWGEVDLTRALIRRIPNKTARRRSKPVLVPLHPSLRDMLSGILEKTSSPYVLPGLAALYVKRIDLVTDIVQGHFKKCGIGVWKEGTGKDGGRAIIEVGFHSLRHTFVSLCRNSNAPLAVVEAIVGHSNPSMTRHYTHVGEIAAGQAVAALPFVMGEPPEDDKARKPSPSSIKQVQKLLQKMTAANWEANRSKAIELLAAISDRIPNSTNPGNRNEPALALLTN